MELLDGDIELGSWTGRSIVMLDGDVGWRVI